MKMPEPIIVPTTSIVALKRPRPFTSSPCSGMAPAARLFARSAIPVFLAFFSKAGRKRKKLPCALCRVPRGQQIPGHCKRIRSGAKDFFGTIESDSSDGHQRLACQSPCFTNEFRSYHGVGLRFCNRGENGADRDIVRRGRLGFAHLLECMRGNTHAGIAPAHCAGLFGGKVLLADMHAIGT